MLTAGKRIGPRTTNDIFCLLFNADIVLNSLKAPKKDAVELLSVQNFLTNNDSGLNWFDCLMSDVVNDFILCGSGLLSRCRQ